MAAVQQKVFFEGRTTLLGEGSEPERKQFQWALPVALVGCRKANLEEV